MRALIGYAPDLGTALQSLLATVHGDLDDRLPITDELLRLSNALGGGGFRQTQNALLRRVRGGLDGRTPLTRTGEAAEGRALQGIVDRLITFDGYLGGPAMAEALTRRAKVAWGTHGQDLPCPLNQGEAMALPPCGEIVIGSTKLGEQPARIVWDITANDFKGG